MFLFSITSVYKVEKILRVIYGVKATSVNFLVKFAGDSQLGTSPVSDLKGFCALTCITNLLEDPKKREPVNQRYVRWWVIQDAHRIVRSFHGSVERATCPHRLSCRFRLVKE